jgi:hypothetical protein
LEIEQGATETLVPLDEASQQKMKTYLSLARFVFLSVLVGSLVQLLIVSIILASRPLMSLQSGRANVESLEHRCTNIGYAAK